VNTFLYELLDVLKVAQHSFVEVLLSVSNVDLVCHLTSDLVDDNWNSTNACILTFACASRVSAVVVHWLASSRGLVQTSPSGWGSNGTPWRFETT
jgi:hypothetical protein